MWPLFLRVIFPAFTLFCSDSAYTCLTAWHCPTGLQCFFRHFLFCSIFIISSCAKPNIRAQFRGSFCGLIFFPWKQVIPSYLFARLIVFCWKPIILENVIVKLYILIFSPETCYHFVVFAAAVILVTCLDLIWRICLLHDVRQLCFFNNSYFHFISLAS